MMRGQTFKHVYIIPAFAIIIYVVFFVFSTSRIFVVDEYVVYYFQWSWINPKYGNFHRISPLSGLLCYKSDK